MRVFVRRLGISFIAGIALLVVPTMRASIFGTIRGIVHDPQHRPIAGATVLMKSATSAYSQTAQTDGDGQFNFSAVTVGDYSVTVTQPGFDASTQAVTVTSGSAPILHFQLQLSSIKQTAIVMAQTDTVSIDSVTPTTLEIGRASC